MALAMLALLSTTAYAAEETSIPTFTASYEVRYGILSGELTLELSDLDPGYLYQTTLSPRGIVAWFKRGEIKERTTLITADGAVMPLDYYRQDTIADPIRNTSYQFDHVNGRVTGEYKSHTIDEPMRAGGHNRISVQVAILLALRSGANISDVSVFDRGRWRDYQFEVIPDQEVKTGSRSFDTVEVRYASPDSDKRWSIHFAKHLVHLPVAFLFHEEGDLKSRAVLTEYTIGGAELSRRK